ncbi:hypothetical protein [Nonomuraea sp. NPDC050783]|uniref:hypothetical protein n=1 Tax=Nonomuraea sp. NPDC050783 TaxID=3154634 RepID=UPI003465B150
MLKRLAATALAAAAATTLVAAPAAASTSSAQLIRTKSYWGHCEDTCKVKVRIKNISRKTLFNVKLNVTLKINGRKVGSCYDSVGSIGAYRVRYAACTVRTARLSNAWDDFQDYGGRYYKYASTYVSYRYYR